jgi:two-component system CheB/CheR fusion protein
MRPQSANSKLKLMLEAVSRAPCDLAEFGRIQFWNRGSEELYGHSGEEAIRKSKDQLRATAVPGSSFAELRAKLLAEGS